MPTPQIKDEKTYQALRRKGNSEEKSARIANAAAGSSRKQVGARGVLRSQKPREAVMASVPHLRSTGRRRRQS